MVSLSIQKEIREIITDSTHGSTVILQKIIAVLDQIVSQNMDFSKNELTRFLFKCITAHPRMAVLVNFANNLFFTLDQINHEHINESINYFLHKYTQEQKNSIHSIQQLFVKQFSSYSNIATYSSSGTIQQCIESLTLQKPEINVICSESRPKYEGTLLAQELSQKNISVTLMTDASFFSQIKNQKVIVIGADAITINGIENKIGSYPLGLLSKYHQIPLYVVSSTYKIVPFDYKMPEEQQKSSNDLLKKSQTNIKINNYYFDTTPLDLFTAIITEKGMVLPKEFPKLIKEIKLHPYLL